MKEVKTQRSRSYHEYLISSLKDPEHAAAFIEVMLELEDGFGFEPELLRSACKDVVEARVQMNNLSEEAKQSYENLDKMLLETKAAELYSLIEFLDALGFRLAIAQTSEEQKQYRLEILFDGTQIVLKELKEKVSEALREHSSDIELKVDSINSAALRLAIKGTIEVIDVCHERINKILFEQSQLRGVRLLDEVGDEIRQQAYPILAEIEQRFRVFVSQALIEVRGFDWWNNLFSANTSKKIRNIQNKSNEAFLNPLECTQFDDLIEVITVEVSEWTEATELSITDIQKLRASCKSLEDLDNKLEEKTKKFSYWNDIFARYFQDRKQWEQIKKSLQDIVIPERHKVMHHRPIRLSAITELLNKKRELFTLLDSAKAKLSEQERTEARQALRDIQDLIKDFDLPQSYPELQAQMQASFRSLTRDLPQSSQKAQAEIEAALKPFMQQPSRQDQFELLRKQHPNWSKPEAQTSETTVDQDTNQETNINLDKDDQNNDS